MAQQALEPVHQLPMLRHAAKRMDVLVRIQKPARQPISVGGGFRRERDVAALDQPLIGLPDGIEQRFGNELGQDDVASVGPLTVECGLFGRHSLDLLRPTVAIQPGLRAGIRKILGAVRG